MRGSAALVLAISLAACSRGEDDKAAAGAKQGTAKQAAVVEDEHVRCALAGAKSFEPACTREITKGAEGEVWVVRHPNGGFRRFVLIDNGARIATADGADEVKAERQGADLEVRVANDRYLFAAAPESPAPHAPAS